MGFHAGQGHLSLDVETSKHECSGMPAREIRAAKLLIKQTGVLGKGAGSK